LKENLVAAFKNKCILNTTGALEDFNKKANFDLLKK
jgi:hypothetical protein